MKRISLLLTLICLTISSYAIEPQTYEFAVIEGDTLRMDVYMPARPGELRPAVIFAFGGGFTNGSRNDPHYTTYLNFLAENGVVAISTDYRPTLKKNPALLKSPDGVAQAFVGAIKDAVSDFHAATCYLIQNAEKFGVDPDKIIASGSSAGAITALQAEYRICNGAMTVLPDDFRYAGVISFAGAILCEGALTWTTRPCPMQLYHGDADRNVPFSTISAGPLSLCGSETIAKSLADWAVPCEFHAFAGVNHSISNSPMIDNLYDILGFVKRIDSGKESLSVNAVSNVPGVPVAPAAKITLEDIINANL